MSSPLLHPIVATALEKASRPYEVVPCSDELADTAQFCSHYGYDLKDSANCIIVASSNPAGIFAACVVLATHKLNNGPAKRLMGASRISFAPQSTAAELTHQEIGGVTPIGLPNSIPVLVDHAVMNRSTIIIGGGNRKSKILCSPHLLTEFATTQVHEGLARLRD